MVTAYVWETTQSSRLQSNVCLWNGERGWGVKNNEWGLGFMNCLQLAACFLSRVVVHSLTISTFLLVLTLCLPACHGKDFTVGIFCTPLSNTHSHPTPDTREKGMSEQASGDNFCLSTVMYPHTACICLELIYSWCWCCEFGVFDLIDGFWIMQVIWKSRQHMKWSLMTENNFVITTF